MVLRDIIICLGRTISTNTGKLNIYKYPGLNPLFIGSLISTDLEFGDVIFIH